VEKATSEINGHGITTPQVGVLIGFHNSKFNVFTVSIDIPGFATAGSYEDRVDLTVLMDFLWTVN